VSNVTSRHVSDMLNKVPEVTLAFWIIKIMSTTVGETGADYLAVHVGLGTAVTGAIMGTTFGTVSWRENNILQRGAHIGRDSDGR